MRRYLPPTQCLENRQARLAATIRTFKEIRVSAQRRALCDCGGVRGRPKATKACPRGDPRGRVRAGARRGRFAEMPEEDPFYVRDTIAMLRPYQQDGPWADRMAKMRIMKAQIEENVAATPDK